MRSLFKWAIAFLFGVSLGKQIALEICLMRLLGSVGAIAVTRVLTSVCPDTRFQVGSAAETITRWASSEEMENYGISQQKWLEQFLELPKGIPSDDTFFQ
jgi:hypothetical protein